MGRVEFLPPGFLLKLRSMGPGLAQSKAAGAQICGSWLTLRKVQANKINGLASAGLTEG